LPAKRKKDLRGKVEKRKRGRERLAISAVQLEGERRGRGKVGPLTINRRGEVTRRVRKEDSILDLTERGKRKKGERKNLLLQLFPYAMKKRRWEKRERGLCGRSGREGGKGEVTLPFFPESEYGRRRKKGGDWSPPRSSRRKKRKKGGERVCSRGQGKGVKKARGKRGRCCIHDVGTWEGEKGKKKLSGPPS